MSELALIFLSVIRMAGFSALVVGWAPLPPSRYGLSGVALRRVTVAIGL